MAAIATDIITAIAKLWPLALVVAICLFAILFRKSIDKWVANWRKIHVRKGEAELAIEGGAAERKAQDTPEAQFAIAPLSEKSEQAQESEQDEPKDFLSQIRAAFMEGNLQEAEAAFEKWQAAEENPDVQAMEKCRYLYFRYRYANDAESIAQLDKLAEDPTLCADALYWLAACHEFSRSYGKAIEVYRRPLPDGLSDDKRARHVVEFSRCLTQIGQASDALQELSANLGCVAAPKAKAAIYRAIAHVHEATKNHVLRAVALQKVLEFTPEEPVALFSAAYALSEASLPTLAATNYSTLLRFKPNNADALNNMGFECETLELPLKRIDYYKKSAKEKATIAMANLAFSYMNEGFEEEARGLLDRAMREENPHRNVGEGLAKLADMKEAEGKEWEKIAKLATILK